MVESYAGKASIEADKRLTDDEAREKIQGIVDKSFAEIQQVGKEKRDETLRRIKDIEGLSIRQIARITGFTVNVVARTDNRHLVALWVK